MNLKNGFFVLLVLSVSFLSCKKDDSGAALEKKVNEVSSSTYKGVFNSSSFQSVDYEVTVTKISATKIKITPEDDNGTTFEVTMSESSTSFLNGDTGQVVFTDLAGVKTLVYNLNGEQFDGTN